MARLDDAAGIADLHIHTHHSDGQGAIFKPIPNLGHDLPASVALEMIENITEFHAASARSR